MNNMHEWVKQTKDSIQNSHKLTNYDKRHLKKAGEPNGRNLVKKKY